MAEDGARVARIHGRTPVVEGPAAVVRACVDALRQVRAAVPADVQASIVGIGISTPGPVDPRRGIVRDTPNMGPDFHDVHMAEEISDALNLPTFLDRDTNVAAHGEMAFGAARGVEDFLYLTVSTGVGGAIVIEGRILFGPDGTAGELGHVPVSADPAIRCGCGGVGHLEAVLGGYNIARTARELVAGGKSPYLAAVAGARGIDALEARDVADGEDAGDEACREIMERGRRGFAMACVGFVDVFNPSRIVVGGSIADAQGDRLLQPARDEVAATAFKTPRSRVQIVRAQLGGDVGLAGCHPLVIARLAEQARGGGRK